MTKKIKLFSNTPGRHEIGICGLLACICLNILVITPPVSMKLIDFILAFLVEDCMYILLPQIEFTCFTDIRILFTRKENSVN